MLIKYAVARKAFTELNNASTYNLIISFKKFNYFINISDFYKKIYFYLSPGMFLKYFNKRKAIKKTKVIKLIMSIYLRKLLLVIKFSSFNFLLKSTPFMLNEVLSTLFKPLEQPFENPLTSKIIDETKAEYNNFRFNYIYFINSKMYNYLKQRKKGRIKRKILRKLIKTNKKID
jgi:hypothetical protein